MRNQSILKQPVSPPFVITLLPLEADMVEKSINTFDKMGFEIQHFGGNEYTIHTVPSSIPGICEKDVLLNLIANLSKENIVECSDSLLMDKIASMACKAAVKGGREIGRVEAEDLIKQLFTLENPFHCPHGRPTMTKMTKYELEKRFGR